MNFFLAIISLLSLLIIIIIEILRPKVNIGIIAIALSFLVGGTLANLSDKNIIQFFPANLFLMLVGVTLFFGIAQENGLLDQLAHRSIRLIRGNTVLLPIMMFLFSFGLSAIGPGNIAATAILAPLGMGLAFKLGVNQLLMAIMIVTGANAGAFSLIAPTGVILHGLAEKINVTSHWLLFQVFLTAALLQTVSAGLAYVIFHGFRISNQQHNVKIDLGVNPINFQQSATLLAILVLIFSIVIFNVPLVIATFVGATILLVFNMADGEAVVKKIPWDTILLVCGVSVLIGLMDKAGGLELFTSLIAQSSFSGLINALMTLITGIISLYSSSSGVVMPAFIPLIPGIIEKLGNTSTTDMLIAIAVGSHMVDVSPLSTLGALCIASAMGYKQKLFRQLLTWGFSMAAFATALSFIFLDLF